MDKLIKENDDFIWKETKSGRGYVFPKNSFWLISESEANENLNKLKEL